MSLSSDDIEAAITYGAMAKRLQEIHQLSSSEIKVVNDLHFLDKTRNRLGIELDTNNPVDSKLGSIIGKHFDEAFKAAVHEYDGEVEEQKAKVEGVKRY